MLQQAKAYPASLWIDSDCIIIDEAQKAPELFPSVKLAVDTGKGKRRFILSGSSNMLLMKRISETLAGRAVYFEMFPMTYAEMEDKTDTPKTFFDLWEPDLKVKEDEITPRDPFPDVPACYYFPLLHDSSLY